MKKLASIFAKAVGFPLGATQVGVSTAYLYRYFTSSTTSSDVALLAAMGLITGIAISLYCYNATFLNGMSQKTMLEHGNSSARLRY